MCNKRFGGCGVELIALRVWVVINRFEWCGGELNLLKGVGVN